MSVIAITGSPCSGKSTVLNIFKQKGASIFCADSIIHSYYKNTKSEIYRNIRRYFPEVLDKNGSIVRQRLGKIVFSQPRRLKKLESIVHPRVIKDLKLWVKNSKVNSRIYAAEVPLLFEKQLDIIFDISILVYTRKSTLVERANRCYGRGKEESLKRIKLFMPTVEKRRLADFVIINNAGFDELKRRVEIIWQKVNREG